MTRLLVYVILVLAGAGCRTTKVTEPVPYTIKEKLGHPFGTILKMNVEIIDGESLNDKVHRSDFLFKIKSVDGKRIHENYILEFSDETGHFPNNDFKLYKYLYGKETGSLSGAEIDKMKKQYAGRTFDILAYETGEFTGIPRGNYDCEIPRQGTGFYFKNYVIAVCDLSKP